MSPSPFDESLDEGVLRRPRGPRSDGSDACAVYLKYTDCLTYKIRSCTRLFCWETLCLYRAEEGGLSPSSSKRFFLNELFRR